MSGTTSLSFTITNPNSSTSLTGVAFTDNLPGGLTASGVTGICGGGVITTSGTSVTLTNATLAPGTSCSFSTPPSPGVTEGVKNNSVTVSSTNAGTGNTSTATLTVLDPPYISESFGPRF